LRSGKDRWYNRGIPVRKQGRDINMSLKHLTKKQHFMFISCVLFVVGLLIALVLLSGKAFAAEDASDQAAVNEYEVALINSYTKKIQLAVTAFYQDENVMVPSYTISLKSVTAETKEGSKNTSAKIVFVVEPYEGPHNQVGTDELTFLASYNSDVTLIDYIHKD
jgi:hypothetical protein